MRRFGLWICFALGFGFAVAMLPPRGPVHAATPGNEQATRQLFQAVQSADLPAAQASIAAGADIEARNRWGMTPTDIAIDRGYYRIAHFLVSVRNQQRAQQAHVSAPLDGESPPEPKAVPAPKTEPALASQSTTEREAAPAVWPAGKPNPFDPGTPAPGAQLSHPSQASAAP